MEFHPISVLEAQEKPEVLAKARKLYEQESLRMRLEALRGKYGVQEADAAGDTQSAVPRLKGRKDINIFALIDYIKSLGLGLEITALPPGARGKREVLLKV
jgi:hypothetical protein